MRRFLTSLPVQASLVLTLAILLIVGLRADASQQLLEAFQGAPGPYEIRVEMQFEPEAFHLTKLQSAGRIVGVDGTSVHVRAVTAVELRNLSWQPWISNLQPLPKNDRL